MGKISCEDKARIDWHCGNLVLDTEQCSKISWKGLEALLSENNKLVDECGSAMERKLGSGLAVGQKWHEQRKMLATLSCW